jgi:outer membrane receptor protein involved in Fe transport
VIRALAVMLALGALPLLPASGAEDEEPPETPSAEEAVSSAPPAEDTVVIEEGSGTVTEALQGKEGVRIQTLCTHCNSANIQVGGLNQELVPITRDRFPLLGGLSTSLVFSMLPADTIADAQVRKGPGSGEAPGAAAGGTIALTEAGPRELPWLDLVGETGRNAYTNATIRAAGPVSSWLALQGIYGKQSVDAFDDDEDGWNDVGNIDREFAEARIRVTPGRRHTIDVAGSWIEDDTTDARGAFDPLTYIQGLFDPNVELAPAWTREDTLVDLEEYRAGWEWTLPGSGVIDLRGERSTRKQSVLSQFTTDPTTILSDFFERFRILDECRWGGLSYVQPLGLTWSVRAGIDDDRQEVTARTIGEVGAASEIATDFVETASGYAELGWNPSPAWNLQLGLRYADFEWGAEDLNIIESSAEYLPRLTLRFAPAGGWSLKLIAGKTGRAPRPIFAEVCCGQRYQRSYFADLETGTTLGFEGIYQPSPDLRLSLYAARTDFDDHILRLVGWSQFWIQTYALANVPEARAETLEAAARWSPVRWLSLDGSIGWLSFHNKGREIVPVLVTPPSRVNPEIVNVPMDRIPYRPVRTGSLALSFSLPRRTTLSVQGNYTGRMLIQQFDEDPFAAQNILLEEMRETSSFWLVNVSAQVPIVKHLDLILAADNLADEIQTDMGDPTTDYNWGPLVGRTWRAGLRVYLDR